MKGKYRYQRAIFFFTINTLKYWNFNIRFSAILVTWLNLWFDCMRCKWSLDTWKQILIINTGDIKIDLTLANCKLAGYAYLAWRFRWFDWISTQYFKWSFKIRDASSHALFVLMGLVTKEVRFYRKPVNTWLKSICSPLTFQMQLPEIFFFTDNWEPSWHQADRDQCKCLLC